MSSVNSINFCAKPKDKKREKKNVKGGLAAITAGSVAQCASMPIGAICIAGLQKPSSRLTKEQIETVNNGAQKVLREITNLGEKKVSIINASMEDYVETPKIPKWLLDKILPTNAVIKGKNAFFNSPVNSVYINKDKLSLATFHELGHAYNFNNSKFWKTMQNTRGIGQLASSLFVLIPALTKEHKAQEGQELTLGQKFTNGFRKACPFLAAGSMIPMILEEGRATFLGNNWAKEIFGKGSELAKKVAKTNKFGLISYAAVTVAAGLASYVTKKVKDASDAKRAEKANQ